MLEPVAWDSPTPTIRQMSFAISALQETFRLSGTGTGVRPVICYPLWLAMFKMLIENHPYDLQQWSLSEIDPFYKTCFDGIAYIFNSMDSVFTPLFQVASIAKIIDIFLTLI